MGKKYQGVGSSPKTPYSAYSTALAAITAKLKPKVATPKQQSCETYYVGDAKEIGDYIPGRSYHAAFSSLEAFTRHIEGLDEKQAWDKSGWEPGKSFAGTENMADCLKLAKEGWHEGAETIERVRAKIQSVRPQLAQFVKYGIAGALPDVPRAVAGNILNMRMPQGALSRKRPVLTLISNMSCLGYIEQSVLTNRAAVVATLIDEIEAAGYACEVISTALSYGCNDPSYRMAHSVIVKNSNQPVDIYRLAFGLGHASMFRRMVFADRGAEPMGKDKCGYGMGRSHGFEDFDCEELASKNVFTLTSANTCASNFQEEMDAATDGIDFLINDLKRQKCPAFPLGRFEEPAEEIKETSDRMKLPSIW